MKTGKLVSDGWWLSNAEEYGSCIDVLKSPDNSATVLLYSLAQWPGEPCFICKESSPEKYLGNKVTFSSWLKTEILNATVQLWIRVDTEDKIKRSGCFDNMYENRIKTTTDWQEISLTVDVPPDSTKIVYGVILSGAGKAWIANPRLSKKEASAL